MTSSSTSRAVDGAEALREFFRIVDMSADDFAKEPKVQQIVGDLFATLDTDSLYIPVQERALFLRKIVVVGRKNLPSPFQC